MPSSGVEGVFSVSIHLTQSQKSPEFERSLIENRVDDLLGMAQYIHSGRPSLHSEIAALRPHGRSSVVFTCGPQQLVDECSVIAMDSGVDFKLMLSILNYIGQLHLDSCTLINYYLPWM
jgi:hypothetical protein